MIEWRFTPGDVARIRFAFSPLLEAVLSLIVLRAPARHSLHLPWIKSTLPHVRGLDLSELFALVPVEGIVADFLTPPPTSPLPELAAELELVRRTPPERLTGDLTDVPGMSQVIRKRICRDPRGAPERIAQTLQTYWDIALSEAWPSVQGLLEADVLWRSRRLAEGGAAALFADLHETVTWHDDRLRVEDPWEHVSALSGEGLLLVPSAMAWPVTRKMVAPYQPMIAYPARGIATLWASHDSTTPDALAALIGRTRARILTVLAEPRSTTALAHELTLTVGTVSQHLGILAANGLVCGARVGRSVLYRRTLRGEALALPERHSSSGPAPLPRRSSIDLEK